MKYVNKRMLIVLNRIVTSLSGGTALSMNNFRGGQSLSFVDRVFQNSVFGQPLYPDLYHMAAAYMFYIIKNHTFIDGNKRTGLLAAITFLEWNGISFSPVNEDKVFDFVISISAGPNDPETILPRIADWLKKMSLY